MTTEAKNLKEIVKQKYGEIAQTSLEKLNTACCCGTQCAPSNSDYSMFNDDYSNVAGYNKDADLKLGCGIPTEVAEIHEGDTVLDLGSGAGNDAFVARALVGETGKVIGIDMTEQMIAKARKNTQTLGYKNVEFKLGDIEDMPIDSNSVDVIISNCVLNLVPDKVKAFAEMHRVLKPGGHFSVSDIVLTGALPKGIQEAAEMYAGCVSGAIERSSYLELIEQTGFKNVAVRLDKPIEIPKQILEDFVSTDVADGVCNNVGLIQSITVYGEK